jgi:hypothetical protein
MIARRIQLVLLVMLLLACGCQETTGPETKPMTAVPPREQMNAVLDEACSTAIELLEKNREFYPFAIVMEKGGGVRHVAGYTGSEMPPSSEVVDVLVAGLKADVASGRLIAVGIVKDVRITDQQTGEKTDAVAVALEHRNDRPVTCYLPYSFQADRLVQRDIVAEQGVLNVFAPDT